MTTSPRSRAPWPLNLPWKNLGSLLVALIIGWAGFTLPPLLLHTPHPFVITEGTSMLPTIRTGEIAVLAGASPRTLHVGEIVAVAVPQVDQTSYHYHALILHRIYRMRMRQGQLWLRTKGDNQSADPFWVRASAVTGRLVWTVPYVGLIPLFAQSRYGLMALGGLLVLALLYVLLQSLLDVLERPASKESEAPPADQIPGLAGLSAAIDLYGQHLMSHTRVMQEMAASAKQLRLAAERQNAILDRLEGRPYTVAKFPTGAVAATRSTPVPPTPRRVDKYKKRGGFRWP